MIIELITILANFLNNEVMILICDICYYYLSDIIDKWLEEYDE